MTFEPTRQFREPMPTREDAPSVWQSIQALQNIVTAQQQKINDVEVQMTRQLGEMNGKLSAIQTTIETFSKALERKVDADEEHTWRGWERDRYQRIDRYPQEQREQRNSLNVNIQTLCIVLALVFSALAAFGVHL